jgi:CheY-like chemotaxis protein
VILLDLMMPVMDGREFREHQLQDPSIAGIPVVVISASRDIDSLVEGLGVLRVFRKPMKLAELLTIVDEAR